MGFTTTFLTYVKDCVLYVEELCVIYDSDFVVFFTSTNHRATGERIFDHTRCDMTSRFRLIRYLCRVLPNDELRRFIDEGCHNPYFWLDSTSGYVRKCHLRMIKLLNN